MSCNDSDKDKAYPMSSLRSASLVSGTGASTSSSPYDPLNLLASTASSALRLDNYTIQPRRELVPGILEDGKVTANHPLVRSYLNRVRFVPNDRDFTPGDDPFGWKPKQKEDREVYEVLGFEKPFTQRESDCIFVLAALKVYYHPRHRAHFTFWGKAACEATAERVQKILDLDPCPVASPIGWMHKDENLWSLEVLQASFFPPNQARRRANGMTLRDRRTANENGARVAPSAPRPKRVRTKPASAISHNPLLTPSRQSARLATATPQPHNPSLPEVPSTGQEVEATDSPVPVLSALPALDILFTPSLAESPLTPSPASQISHLPDVEEQEQPAPARRSTRVPKKRQIFSPAPVSLPPTPETAVQVLQDALSESVNVRSRARSSSSAQSDGSYTSNSSTAVSSDGNASTDTVVEETTPTGEKGSKKRKRVVEEEAPEEAVGEDEDAVEEAEDMGVVGPEEKNRRTSSRSRKSTAKAKSTKAAPVKSAPPAKKARTRTTKAVKA